MTQEVFGLVRWDWFKLRRRWMPWILLLVLLLFSQIQVWGQYFNYKRIENQLSGSQFGFSIGGQMYHLTCQDIADGNIPPELKNYPPAAAQLAGFEANCERLIQARQDQLSRAYSDFTLPGALTTSMSVANGIGLVLIAVLTASAIGTEYGWGTLRFVLSRGIGRRRYLASKLILMALAGLAGLIVAALVTMISATIAHALAGAPPGGYTASSTWGDAVATLGKGWFALLPYIALPAVITVVTRSSAAGMAVALGYNFGESIIVGILGSAFDWFHTIADYTLNQNISAWMITGQNGTSGFGPGFFGRTPPDHIHAFVVVLVYAVVLGGLAFWSFQRRDVGGASGT